MNKMTLTTLIAAGALALSCNDKALLDPATYEPSLLYYAHGDTSKPERILNVTEFKKYDYPSISNSIVVQDTVMGFTGVKLHGKPIKDVDLSKLKNNKDTELKTKNLQYVAIGSSLTAGVRDGGYFNEGILTAYPELIARQMKLTDFKSPVFEATQYNGLGRKVKTNYNPSGGPVQKYALVTNNTAIDGYDEIKKQPKLKKSKDKYEDFNNLATPDLRFDGLIEYNAGAKLYQNRFASTTNFVKSDKKFDFFTYEAGSADFSNSSFMDASGLDLRPEGMVNGKSYIRQFLKKVSTNNMKGVFLNMPNHLVFPGHKQILCSDIYKNSNGILDYTCTDDYYPTVTSKSDSLASPRVSIILKTKNWIAPDENGKYVGSYERSKEKDVIQLRYNKETAVEIGIYGYPIVDVDKMYDKILMGVYITDDGVRVNPDWKTGNFFSTDGFFPTAFGHAIIANEIIKVINTHYKTSIPLIPTREYLNN